MKNFSKKHLKRSQLSSLSKSTSTNKQIGRWYGQIEDTEEKKNRPSKVSLSLRRRKNGK